jgi:protein arginine kinase activator
MICDVCKTNTATVYLTQIVDGNMKKINLCEACSKDKGVSDPTGFALADLLLGLGETQQVTQSAPSVLCVFCGFAHAHFKKMGLL